MPADTAGNDSAGQPLGLRDGAGRTILTSNRVYGLDSNARARPEKRNL